MCYEAGLWQAYLDKELDPQLEEEMKTHLEECSSCRQILSEMKEQQGMIGNLLTQYREETEKTRFNSSLGWEVFIQKEQTEKIKGRGLNIMGYVKSLSYKKVAAVAAIITLGASLGIAPVRSAAAQFLQVFRVERLTTVNLTYEEIRDMQKAITEGVGQIDLEGLGQLEFRGERKTETVAIEDIKGSTNFSVKLPSYLPEGYGANEAAVDSDYSAVFNLNVDKVNQVLRALGTDKQLPEEADGKEFVVVVPQNVYLTYYDKVNNKKISLTQGQSPQLNISGDVDVEALREAVLDLPILPGSLKSKLAGINDWQHTLVLPGIEGKTQEVSVNGNQGIFIENEPANEVKVEFTGEKAPDGAATIEVNGQKGIVTENRSTSTAALIWYDEGIVYALSGEIQLAEALKIAESMR